MTVDLTRPVVSCPPLSRRVQRLAAANGETLTPLSCVECQRRIAASPRTVAAMRNGAQPCCRRCVARLQEEVEVEYRIDISPYAHPQGPAGFLADAVAAALNPAKPEPEPTRAEQHARELAHSPNVHQSRYRRRSRGR